MKRRTWMLLGIMALVSSCKWQSESGEETDRTIWREQERQVRAGIRASEAEDMAMGISTSPMRFVQNLTGFAGPESVKYDAEQDAFFITNQTGPGSEHDGNGYIARVSAGHPDSSSVFAQGGKDGVVLDSPKGTALHGDTLWVADIDHLRAFHRKSGVPLANIDFGPLGAVQLNDIDIAGDGTIRVTDTGIIMSRKGVIWKGPARVFIVGPSQQISEMSTPTVSWPNGIKWDAPRSRWVIVSFDAYHGRVYELPKDGGQATVIRDGKGKLDGLEILSDGSLLFVSWADSSLHRLKNGRETMLLREIPEPADIGIDTKRNRIAVPLAVLGRVQLWSLNGVEQSR